MPIDVLARVSGMPLWKRTDDALKNGVPVDFDSATIFRASSRLAASGLSMKTRLPALNTGVTCARCGRPSTLVSRTTSTLASSASMLSTSSTP